MDNHVEFKKGILFALGAHLLWETLPTYWRFIHGVSAFEILAYRIILAIVFMALMIFVLKKSQVLKHDINQLIAHPIQLVTIIIAGYVITINWGTFIWAVSNGHVLRTSLGYYVNPLVSVLLAFIFSEERFNTFETLAIISAAIGVIYMTMKIGGFPTTPLMPAFSFGVYGLLKKLVRVEVMSGIAIECIVTAPAGLIYIVYLRQVHQSSVGLNMSTFLLSFPGAVTAVPLILFSAGARRIPLSLTGFIQYVSPTIIFLLGIFVFREKLDIHQFITFIFIWTGIVLYSISQYIKTKRSPRPK